ncbi:uncharacterized protein LOC125370447 [Ricinus communis]|uniref:Uncharacterized protein n=1 Tax=Ricinus communis TaxID=3988 RepID=B9RYB5_RICCO|nr:uncharacterized protein LOC125370447 [Ricinus communis]EEF43624.1 conserved hypothetical protein [Ricinus communis]
MSKNMGTDHNLMNESIEDHEDGFYDELRKQILLLTADEDDECSYETGRQCSKRLTIIATQPTGLYFNSWETENGNLTPSWLVNLWRHGNGGTGVFIPHIHVKSRRKQRSGKKSNWRRRMSKQVDENKQS